MKKYILAVKFEDRNEIFEFDTKADRDIVKDIIAKKFPDTEYAISQYKEE